MAGLYLGDSSATLTFHGDKDKRNLVEMLRDAYPDLKAHAIGGYTTENYATCLEMEEKEGNSYDWIILVLNLRSFSPQWHYYPTIDGVWDMNPSPKAMRKYREQPVYYPLCPKYTTMAEFLNAGTYAERFIMHYGYPLTPDHPKLIALGRCAALMEKLSPRIMMYFTPINHMTAFKLCGQPLFNQINDNKVLIKQYTWTAKICDYSNRLMPENFPSNNDFTEHLRDIGRWKVTQWMVDWIEHV